MFETFKKEPTEILQLDSIHGNGNEKKREGEGGQFV